MMWILHEKLCFNCKQIVSLVVFQIHILQGILKTIWDFSFFICHDKKKQEHTANESSKFKGSIHKTVKPQKSIYLGLISLTKQFNLIGFLCCDNKH